MFRLYFILTMYIVLLFTQILDAEITPKVNKGKMSTLFGAESCYVGADLVVDDSTEEIIVTWKKGGSHFLGELYFMQPGMNDSARFVFHNKSSEIQGEQQALNIGKFPEGTKLFFMYTVTDSNRIASGCRGKKLYSGQNRIGIDTYISDVREPFYKGRWAAIANNTNESVTIGFNDDGPWDFRSILFSVSGVKLSTVD